MAESSTPAPQPNVIVLPDRDTDEAAGINTLKDLETGRARVWRARPLSEVIQRRYRTYAHVCLYSLPGEDQWPRINKVALPELRDEGAEPVVWGTALDYDTTGHLPLDVDGYRELLGKFKEAQVDFLPTYVWKTRSGARFLFVHPPLTPERSEGFHCWLRDHYEEHGIPCDPKVWEWNRPHALPWVVRDEAPLDPDLVLEWPALTALPDFPDKPVPLRLNARTLRQDEPDPVEAGALVWKDGDSTGKLTEWGAWAKGRMAGREAASAWEVPALPEKTRNPTLFKWAASLVSMCYGFHDTAPVHVFGVLAPTVEANLRANLYHEVWRAVCYCWAKEEAQKQQEEVSRRGFLDTFKDEVRKWAPDAPDAEEEFTDWVRSRLIVIHDSNYYVLKADGRYGVQPVRHQSLVSAVRTSGLVGTDRVIQRLTRLNDKGREEPLRCQDVVDKWSLHVDEVVMQGGAKLGGVLEPGGVLAVTTFARRSDLVPTRSDWVEGWFDAWFGEHKPQAEEWFAGSLDFEGGPICALSLDSPGGSGKNLVMVALARTITSKTYSPAKQVIGTFQPKLGKTPFVHVDETWPFEKGVHAAFRGLIGTWTQSVNRKNIHESDIRTCPRILMTANKSSLVEVLFGDKDMTSSEHEATAERVIHMRLGRGGKKWLDGHGGMNVASGKLESDEISRHLLWLHETIPRSRHGRFLMVGDPADPYLLGLGFKGVAVLGEVLVKMFEFGRINPATPLRAGLILEFMDNQMLTDRTRGYNLITLGRDLRGFLNRNRTINLAKLRDFAAAAGMRCPKVVAALARVAT